MKKLLIFLMVIVSLFLLFAYNYDGKGYIKKENKKKESYSCVNNDEVRGVFISYIDYAPLKGKTRKDKMLYIDKMINNVASFNLNSVILQVRPFSDAIYKSSLFLSSNRIFKNEGDKLDLDILDYFIKESKKKNIDVYAWVNPYRIRNTSDLSDISENNFYYKWIGTNNIEISKEGIYLNPASDEVIEYITNGLKELCKYDISGILYDDYFYPNKTIDLENYEKSNKKVSISEYRINNVNKLLKESYKVIKDENKNIKFGISPAGNIANNLNNEYLDVENVLKSDYLDFVIPQLYFGFANKNMPYINSLDKWISISNNKDFYVGLSLYKSGRIDKFALSGKNEWIENDDIIMKQILISRNRKDYNGFFIYSYKYLLGSKKNNNLNNEVKNLSDILNI